MMSSCPRAKDVEEEQASLSMCNANVGCASIKCSLKEQQYKICSLSISGIRLTMAGYISIVSTWQLHTLCDKILLNDTQTPKDHKNGKSGKLGGLKMIK